MIRLTRRTLFSITVVALIIYLVAAFLIPTPILIELLNGLFLGLVGAVTIVFAPLFWRAIRVKKFDRVAQLTIGIILTWFSLILSRGASTAGKIVDHPGWLANSQVVAVAAYLAIIGGILHITAPGMFEDKLRYNRGLLALALIAGLCIAGVTIWLQRHP